MILTDGDVVFALTRFDHARIGEFVVEWFGDEDGWVSARPVGHKVSCAL